MTGTAKESGARGMRGFRAMRLAAASGLAVVLACGAVGTAVGAPSERRQVHVEGRLLQVDGSTGGLPARRRVGRYLQAS